ncbi:SRPBCC family protein [Streptomyces niveus]|uniref:SRPBCC family protein n=1 Tax=Streptomyces niveus TaxID=193462 RepID=UPI003693742B
MEHEVFIPVPAETLREALRDHARVARCVPGLQQDADASARPLSGRLKVRVGGHTITYRGALTLTERAGAFTAKGEGAEVRGTGATKVSVRIRLTETPGGTTVAFTTTSTPTSEGRLSDVTPSTAETTARRLLDRFAAALAKPGAGSLAGAGDDSGSTPTSGESTTSGAEAGRDAPDAPGQGRDAPPSDAGSAAGRDAIRADGRPDDAAAAHAAGSGDADRAAGRDSGASGGDGQDVPRVGAPEGRGAAASDDASDAGPQAADGGGDAADVASADEPSAGAGAVPDRDGADPAHAAEADDRSGGADRAASRGSAASGGDGQDVGEPGSDAGSGAGPDALRADGPEGRGAAASDDASDAGEQASDASGGGHGRGTASAGEEQPGRADDASGATPEFDGLELPDDPDPDLDASAGFGATASGDGDFLVPLEPPAEAAHARRTMIGRSAEEVDHAPPRGRYAPEQGPDSGGAGVALRWVAPAAALAIAGAVVVGRALRRRR